MGSVPWDCDMCQQTHLGDPYMNRARASTHLEVLLRSLLPLLGHGARPDGAGEHAGEGEDGEGTGDDGERDEQNLAALIRRRGTAGAVGTEGDEIGCQTIIVSMRFLSKMLHAWGRLRWVPRANSDAPLSTPGTSYAWP